MLPEQYTVQDSGFKNSNTKKFFSYLAVVLCAVAGILLAYAYIIYFHGGKYGDVVAIEQSERQTSEDSVESFFKDRDYEQSISELEKAYDNLILDKKVGGGGEEEAVLIKIEHAGLTLRTNPVAAYDMFAELYNDPAVPDHLRARVLKDVMWSFASSYGNEGKDLAFAQEKIFTPTTFDVLPDDFIVKDRTTVMQAVVYGFDKVLELDPNPDTQFLAYMLRAHYAPSFFKWDFNNPDEKVLGSMVDHVEKARAPLLSAQERSEAQGTYSPVVAAGLFYGLLRNDLYFVYSGVKSKEDFFESVDMVLDYVTPFKDQNFNAGVFSAEATLQYIIASVVLNDFDLLKIDTRKIQKLLDEHVYTLSDEDLERRRILKSRGDTPDQAISNYPDLSEWILAYQAALIVIANDIDPNFKTFLINRVDGWDNVNFNYPGWFNFELPISQ